MEIDFHDRAWQCPICKKWKYVKDMGKSSVIAKCCGRKFRVITCHRKRVVQDHIIIAVDEV